MRYPYPDEILWQDGTGQPRFLEEVVVVLFFFAVVADADGFVCGGRLLVEPADVPVSDLDSLADSFTEAISKSFWSGPSASNAASNALFYASFF